MEFSQLKKRVEREIPPYLSGAFDVVCGGSEGDFWDVMDLVTHTLAVDPEETWGRFNRLLGCKDDDVSSTFQPVVGSNN